MADTDIVLSVDLDVKDAEKTAQQLQDEVKKLFNSDKSNQSASVTNLETSLKKTYHQIKDVTQQMDELGNTQVPTEQFSKLSEAVDTYDKQFDSLAEKMSKFEEAGGDITSDKYQKWVEEMERIETAHDSVYKRMEKMKENGTAFISGRETDEYAQLEKKLDSLNDKLKQQIIRYNEITNNVKDTTQKTEKLKDSTEKVRKSTKSATVETEKMKTATEKVQKATKNVSSGFLGITKYAKKAVVALGAMLLGARGLWSLFNKMRSGILEGFKNIQESGIGPLKKQMNDLTNASTTLKNALAGAFSPIVTTVIPYIQRLVEWLTIGIDKIAQFIAAISGQKTYIKAIKQVGDAAQKAGNQAKGSLASFDKLNVLTTSGGNGNQFTEEVISEEVLSKLDEMKKKFEEIKAIAEKIIIKPFLEGFDKFDITGKFKELKDNALKFTKVFSDFLDKIDKSKMLGVLESASRLMGSIAGFIAYIAETLANSAILTLTKFFERDGDRLVAHIDTINGLVADIMNEMSDILEHSQPLIDFFDSDAFTTFQAAVLGLITELTAGPLEIILTIIKDVLGMIDDTLAANAEKISTALQTMCEVVTPLVDDLKEGFGELWDKIKKVWEEDVKPAVEDFTQTVSDTFGDVTDCINENKDTWQAWSDKIGELLNEYVFPIIQEIAQIVGSVIAVIIRLITQLWKNVIKPFIDWISPYILPILTKVFNFITTTTKHVLAVVRFVLDIISTLLKSLCKLLEGDAVGAWETLKTGVINAVEKIKEVFGPVVDFIMEGISKIVDGFNTVKNLFSGGLTLKADVQQQGPVNRSGGGAGRGFASGGVIPPYASEHLIKVGDNKHETEVVSPLSTMQEAMFNALQQAGLSNGKQEIVLQLDGKTFMRAMIQQNNDYIRRTGSSAFAY